MRAHYGSITGVILDALFLLEARLMRFVDDDQAEVAIGEEQGGTGADHDLRVAAGGCAPGASGNRCANETGAVARAAASNIVVIGVLILAFSCLAILETRLESCTESAPLGGSRHAAAPPGCNIRAAIESSRDRARQRDCPARKRSVTRTVVFASDVRRSAKLFADDELQAGPNVVDRAHLDVNEAERQRDLADHVFRDIGGDLRRFLRP